MVNVYQRDDQGFRVLDRATGLLVRKGPEFFQIWKERSLLKSSCFYGRVANM